MYNKKNPVGLATLAADFSRYTQSNNKNSGSAK